MGARTRPIAVLAAALAGACSVVSSAPPDAHDAENSGDSGEVADATSAGDGGHSGLVRGAPALAPMTVFAPPVPRPEQISSTFGPRWKTSAGRTDFHPGIDYFDVEGTPLTAIGDGVVEAVHLDGSSSFPNGGNVLVVRHALPAATTFHGQNVDRFYAVYLHLASFAVADGESVTRGQVVGAMGRTGDTDFVHLHFETRVQTLCSMQYQTANPMASCAIGFDPHVHPFRFVGGRNDDAITVGRSPPRRGRAGHCATPPRGATSISTSSRPTWARSASASGGASTRRASCASMTSSTRGSPSSPAGSARSTTSSSWSSTSPCAHASSSSATSTAWAYAWSSPDAGLGPPAVRSSAGCNARSEPVEAAA